MNFIEKNEVEDPVEEEEDNVRILYDIDFTLCRLCQEYTGTIEFLMNKTLCEQIRTFTNIHIENNGENFPKSVCENCIELLNNFHIFQETCRQVNEQLTHLLIQHSKGVQKSVHFNGSVETEIYTDKEPIHEQKYIILKFEESQTDEDTQPQQIETEQIRFSEETVNNDDEEISSPTVNVYYHTEENVIYDENDLNYEVEHLDYSDLENSKSDVEGSEELVNLKSDIEKYESDGGGEIRKDIRHYICPECNKFYTQKRSLKRHVLSAHPDQPDVWRHVKAFKSCICIECRIPFRDKIELKTHVLSEHPDKPHIWQLSDERDGDQYKKQPGHSYACNECGNMYTEIRSLKRHVVSKHPDKPDIWKQAKDPFTVKRFWRQSDPEHCFRCNECGNKYSYFRSLRRHAFKIHGMKISASESENLKILNNKMENPSSENNTFERKLYDCKLCGKMVTEKRSLRRHLQKMHPGTVGADLADSLVDVGRIGPKYLCNVDNCAAAFSNKENFQRHQYKEHGVKAYLCPKCGKRFRDIKNLESHETYHLDVMPHKCPKCELRFRHSANLKVHIRNHHEGHRFYCSKCGRAFLSNCTRKRHELIHAGIKEFKCDQCPGEFYTIKELKCHQRYHNDIRPHFCDICYKTFVTKTVLRVHMRSHTGERPFKCDLNGCSKSFAEKAKLYRHQRNIHHVNPRTGETF